MLKQSKIVIYALLALLLVGVFYSLKVGIADIYAHQADRLERRWIKHGEVKSFKDWQQANSWVDKALWLDGDHPDYLLTKGRLATWRFFVTKDGTGIEQLKQQAMPGLGFIESSIAVRPGWPYAWSTLVRLKAQLGELDERFYFAFEQAKVLGTWEPDVQMTLFDVGLGAWASLPWSERFYILELFNTPSSPSHLNKKLSLLVLSVL